MDDNRRTDESDNLIVDYYGEQRLVTVCLVLTAPSEYEGEYAVESECETHMVHMDGGYKEVTVLVDEWNDNVRHLVCGDPVWFPHMEDGYQIRYIDGCRSRHEGEWAWSDDTLYCEDDGETYHIDDEGNEIWWSDRRECYVTEYDAMQEKIHPYHGGFRRDYTTPDTRHTIGFEVEKEDSDVIYSWDLHEVDDTGWCREADSSLCESSGFELVSPVFDLFTDRLDTQIKESRVLREHLGADYSSACGGHINVGKRGTSGEDFFDSILAFVPLFLAIWRHRLGNTYSPLKRKPVDYKRAGKYSAVNVQSRYIEFRLPPAFKSSTNLLWRRDLMRIMCKNEHIKPLQVITMMLSPKNELGVHLRKVYSEEQVFKVVSLYAQFADDLYGSYDFSADGVGVFFKSAVRRLKNRKVKGSVIVTYSQDAVDRLVGTYGSAYRLDAQPTLNAMDELSEK